MKIKAIFRWFDFYVGLYWDRQAKVLYIFPVPMLGLRLAFRQRKHLGKFPIAGVEHFR